MTFEWIFVIIPLAVVWVFVSYDVARDEELRPYARGLWILAFTLVWPTMLLWLLIRRPGSRLDAVGEKSTDPRAILVESTLEHECGLIDDEQMNDIKRDLRPHTAS